MKQFLLFIYIFSFCNNLFAEVVLIKDIDVVNDDHKLYIIFSLNKPYKNLSSIEYGKGFVKLTLPNISFNKKLSFVSIDNEFIRNIRLSRFQEETFIEIELKDEQLNLTNQVDAAMIHGAFEVSINKQKALPKNQTQVIDRPLNDIMPDKVSHDNTIDTTSATYLLPTKKNEIEFGSSLTGNFYSQIIQSLLALLFILGILFIFFKFYLKTIQRKALVKNKKFQIQILDTFYLNPKQKLIVISIKNYVYACSVTQTQINVIGHIPNESLHSFNEILYKDNNKINMNKIKALFQERQVTKKEGIAQKSPIDIINDIEQDTSKKPTTFKEELLSKIQNLKPID